MVKINSRNYQYKSANDSWLRQPSSLWSTFQQGIINIDQLLISGWDNQESLDTDLQVLPVQATLLTDLCQVSANLGTCSVVGLDGTLDEAKVFTFTLECTYFLFYKCPI